MWINAKQMNKMDFYTVKTITRMVSDYLNDRGIRPAALARMVETPQQNLSKKLAKNHMDSYWIEKISTAVNHNFFKDLSDEYEREINKGKSVDEIVEEPLRKYGKPTLEAMIEEIVDKKLKSKRQ